MEMIILSVWVVLDCTINHLSLNLTATQWCQPQHAARNVEQPCCLRKILTEKMQKINHIASCLPVQAWDSKTTTCFTQPFSGPKPARLHGPLGIPGVSSPTSGYNLELSLVQPFPWTHTQGLCSGAGLPLWSLMRALIIPTSSPQPHFLGDEFPLLALAEVLFWMRYFFLIDFSGSQQRSPFSLNRFLWTTCFITVPSPVTWQIMKACTQLTPLYLLP